MPYAAHTYAFFGGTLLETAGQPTEIWQTGVRVTGVTDLAAYLAALGGNNDDVDGTIKQWWLVADNATMASATLDWVRVAAVTPTEQEPALTHFYSSPIPGTREAAYPNFVTTCITLETAVPSSDGGRGRVYPPLSIGYTGGSISTANAHNVAETGVSLMDAMSGGGTLSAVPVVASKKFGTLKPVTACSCDCILDTQRRRRNALIEFRQTVSL